MAVSNGTPGTPGRPVRREWILRSGLFLFAIAVGCAGEQVAAPEPEGQPLPPAGPHFSVFPIGFDSIARITPLGHNNKVLPVGHTYWDTCDRGYLLPGGRACWFVNLPVRAPGGGVVFSIAPGDGHVSIEGPPGLFATFLHITPIAGLQQGDSVRAGDVIGTMFQTNSFDFGVTNYAVHHTFVRPERYPESYLHAQNPLEQFPQPMRSQLESRVMTRWDAIGRLSYDVAGTAAGNWFKEGSPASDQVFTPDWVHAQLFLGRRTEREATRIVVTGDRWAGLPNPIAVVDDADPSWDAISPASGQVPVRLWGMTPEGEPNTAFPHGTLLIEMLSGTRLRIEWFEGHEAPAGFTSAAFIYER